jgi:hypothetical protein
MSINLFGQIDWIAFNLGFFHLGRRSVPLQGAAATSAQIEQSITRGLSCSGVMLIPQPSSPSLHGSGDLPAGGERRDLARQMPGESSVDDLHAALGFFEYPRP